MDRYEALYSFWSSFGIPAFEENSVPTGDEYPDYPYITYEVASGGFNADIQVNGYIWTRSNSWTRADNLADEIALRLKNGGEFIPFNGGALWITARDDFTENMTDYSDDKIKRKILNVVLHYI